MKEVLFSHELRGRISDLEYSGITKKAIRQIYFEETGKKLKIDFDIYHSNNYKKSLKIGENGFDGTIIHFLDKSTGVNQMYSIARGSEKREDDDWRPQDWVYNLNAIFIGKNGGQYSDASLFNKHVTSIIEEENRGSNVRLVKIGLGHSLGGNTIQMQQLKDNEYEKVYTINAAQPTVYQLAYVDKEFGTLLFKNYKLDKENFNEIYTINPKALVQFADDYYKDSGKNIHRLVAKEDLLLAVGQNIPGFVFPGSVEEIVTMKDFEGIGKVLGEISDKDLQAIRLFLAKYVSSYNDKGFDGAVQTITGIDLKLVEKIIQKIDDADFLNVGLEIIKSASPITSLYRLNSIVSDKDKMNLLVDNLSDMKTMIVDMNKKIPELIRHFTIIRENIDSILDTFVKHGYMDNVQKKDVLNAIKGIEKDLKDLSNLVGIFKVAPSNLTLLLICLKIKNTLNHVETIKFNFKDFIDELNKSIQGHSISNLLNAIADEKEKEYKGTDIIVTVTSNGKKIKMNLSSAIRIYTKGMAIYDEKEEILRRMKVSFENVYLNDFDRRKAELLEKISDMETYPSKYQYLLGNTTSYGANYITVIRSITVHEVIPPLPQSFLAVFEGMFKYYEQEIQLGREKLGEIRKMIEDYFQYDHQLAQTIGIGG